MFLAGSPTEPQAGWLVSSSDLSTWDPVSSVGMCTLLLALLLFVCGCWEEDSRPLEEQYALFSTGLSLQFLIPTLGVGRITRTQHVIAWRLCNALKTLVARLVECLPSMHEALPEFYP